MSQYPPPPSPYEPPKPYNVPHFSSGSDSRLKGPAIAIMVCGILGILFLITDFGFRVYNLANDIRPPAFGNQPANREAQTIGMYGGLVFDVIAGVLQVVVVIGGWMMMNRKSYSLAMAAAIISVIPCFSSCCIVGIPFGIWAMVVLMDPQVKSSFH